MNWVVDVDTSLLRLLNIQWIHPFLDRVIPIFSHFAAWRIPLIVFLILIMVKERLKGFIIVAGLGLTIRGDEYHDREGTNRSGQAVPC
jgi:hypothetical protein